MARPKAKDSVHLNLYLFKYQIDFLKQEAHNKRTSSAALIREAIDYLILKSAKKPYEPSKS